MQPKAGGMHCGRGAGMVSYTLKNLYCTESKSNSFYNTIWQTQSKCQKTQEQESKILYTLSTNQQQCEDNLDKGDHDNSRRWPRMSQLQLKRKLYSHQLRGSNIALQQAMFGDCHIILSYYFIISLLHKYYMSIFSSGSILL